MLRQYLTSTLIVIGQTLLAQAPTPGPPDQPFVFSATSELVLLDVAVRDARGTAIRNLAQEDFQVYEDGKLQNITQFANDDVPVTVGLVIDTSGSMRQRYAHLVGAALAFIQESNRNDEVFIVNFGDHVTYGLPNNLPFSGDASQLRAALVLALPAGKTALYDALLSALEHLDKGRREKKMLVLVSDGGDNGSLHGLKEVMQGVRESRATIYTIGLFDEDDTDQNPRLLRRFAQVSGGEALFPATVRDVTDICRRIARDIRSRYTIGYVPVRSAGHGSHRKIKVVASGPGGHRLVVNTRTSYSLPDANRQTEPTGKSRP